MVTQNMHFLESHLALPSEPPPIMENDVNLQSQTLKRARLSPEKKLLQREDPMSHRIIEKRRRDRMNNCLADLSRLIPAEYLKKGRGRIEKTEIIEMAIKHMKYLHGLLYARSPNARSSTELPLDNSHLLDNYDLDSKVIASKEESAEHTSGNPAESSSVIDLDGDSPPPINLEHFKLGYQECLSESMHYLVEVKGYYPGSSLCMQLICHLQKHCDKLLKGDRLNKPRAGDSNSTSNCSNSSMKPHGSGSSSGDSCERLQLPSIERLQPKPEPSECPYDATTPRDLQSYDTASHHQHQDYERGTHTRYEPAVTQARDYSSSPRHNQGRDNLTLPNLSLFNIEQETQGGASSRHPHEIYPTETSPCPSLSADNSQYKFKNNIKQRFSAEHSINSFHQNGSSSGYLSAPPTERLKTSDTNVKYDDSPSNDSHYESRLDDFPSDLSRHYEGAPRSVPIFVLHGDGTFYIPLTVDYTSLIPYLGAFSLRRSSRTPPPVLHPVTLSVCFQQNGSAYLRQHTISGASSSEYGTSSLVKVHK